MSDNKPAGTETARQRENTPPCADAAGGWGSRRGVGRILDGQRPSRGAIRTPVRRSKTGSHMCLCRAPTSPAHPHPFALGQNGAKATVRGPTRDCRGSDFFLRHILMRQRRLPDHNLEKTGLVTYSLPHDAACGRYVAITWEQAFHGIGARLRALDSRATVFYAWWRASLEASCLYALYARLCGRSTLSGRSGMCRAALAGLCKRVIERDERAGGTIIDRALADSQTIGVGNFAAAIKQIRWGGIERVSGLRRADLETAGDMCRGAERTIGVYMMGLTRHVRGWLNLKMYVNLLLLRGNTGRQGAGIFPERGHSNMQGKRIVGITEQPKPVPNGMLRKLFGFDPPVEEGRNTAAPVRGLLDVSVKGVASLGGNAARAIPDGDRVQPCWGKPDLNMGVAIKPNRPHLFPGGHSWQPPRPVRTGKGRQADGPQAVTTKDRPGMIHASLGKRKPASPRLKSEIAMTMDFAEAALGAGDRTTRVTPLPNHRFNTTIHGISDRLRGLTGRDTVLINPENKARQGQTEGQAVTLECAIDDRRERTAGGPRVVGCDRPDNRAGAPYPEANPPVPMRYRDELSHTPARKGLLLRVRPAGAAAEARGAA